MFEYEIHRTRHAELVRRADEARLARDVVQARRAERRRARHAAAETESHRPRQRRHRFARVA
ncbi:hypothetical protein [Streptomyces sp. NPDC058985]|uniref:hypothetical protein n=1 Tax=Streptomyces sp. NPDC058985 TaxID=3346684 RepID=UPI00368E0534